MTASDQVVAVPTNGIQMQKRNFSTKRPRRHSILLATLLLPLSGCVMVNAGTAYDQARYEAIAQSYCESEGGLRTFGDIPDYIDRLTLLKDGGEQSQHDFGTRDGIGRQMVSIQTGGGSLADIVATTDRRFNSGSFSFSYLLSGRVGAVDLVLTNFRHENQSPRFFDPGPDQPDGYYRYSLAERGDARCQWSEHLRELILKRGSTRRYVDEFYSEIGSHGQCLAIEYLAPIEEYQLDGYALHHFRQDLLDEPIKQSVEQFFEPDGNLLAEWRNFLPSGRGHACDGNRTLPLARDLHFSN